MRPSRVGGGGSGPPNFLSRGRCMWDSGPWADNTRSSDERWLQRPCVISIGLFAQCAFYLLTRLIHCPDSRACSRLVRAEWRHKTASPLSTPSPARSASPSRNVAEGHTVSCRGWSRTVSDKHVDEAARVAGAFLVRSCGTQTIRRCVVFLMLDRASSASFVSLMTDWSRSGHWAPRVSLVFAGNCQQYVEDITHRKHSDVINRDPDISS